MTLQLIASAVMELPASGSGGQLFVYEYECPGRSAAAVQADHAKNAVSLRISSGLVIHSAGAPPRGFLASKIHR